MNKLKTIKAQHLLKITAFMAVLFLFVLLILGLIHIVVTDEINEHKITQEHLTLTSQPIYTWQTLSARYPIWSIRVCSGFRIELLCKELGPDTKVTIEYIKQKANKALWREEFSFIPQNNDFEYDDKTNTFFYELRKNSILGVNDGDEFSIILNINIEKNGRQKNNTYVFRHFVTRHQRYYLYPWDCMSKSDKKD